MDDFRALLQTNRHLMVLCLVILISLPAAVFAAGQDDPIGRIRSFEGDVQITHNNTVTEAAIDAPVFQEDEIATGSDGTVAIVFIDDSSTTMGPNSHLVIDSFVFSPASKDGSLVLRLLEGALFYASGLIAKLSPNAAAIKTPDALIGLRGTRVAIEVSETFTDG